MSKNKRGTAAVAVSEQKESTHEMTMLTLSQASAQYGIKKPALKALLTNSRYASIFSPENVKVTHFHPDVPDLIEVNPIAIDQYLEVKAHGGVAGKRFRTANKPRKYLLYMPDAISADVRDLLDQYTEQGLTLDAAYKSKKADSTPVAANDNAAPVEINEVQELIEA